MYRRLLISAICCTYALIGSPAASADKLCEDFVQSYADSVIKLARQHSEAGNEAEFSHFVLLHVDLSNLTRFTLGSRSNQYDSAELGRLELALKTYLVSLFTEHLARVRNSRIEILGSSDRRVHDCVVESAVFNSGGANTTLLWRVHRDHSGHKIFDVAIKDAGNTLWMSLELRAQFAAVLDQNNGSIDAVIGSLN